MAIFNKKQGISDRNLKKILVLLNILLVFSMFSLGFISYPVLSEYVEMGPEYPFSVIFLDGKTVSSPSNFIEKDKILIYPEKVVINLPGATISSYEDTGSMKPTLDSNSNGIRIKPYSEDDIEIGDIVSFRKDGFLIVHRVIEKGIDSQGTYFVTKGDNNNFNDGKIRFQDIEYLTVGILY